MEFDNSFDVPLSPEQAWSVLMDIPRIAPCMPGAELTELVDPQHFKGKISVRLGPVALAFAGRVEIDSIDEAGRSARIKAQGSDAKGRGAANATATFHIEPSAEGSRVMIHTDLMLSGAVAQYGRGVGMIQATAAQIIGQFAGNLRKHLAQQPPPAPKRAAGCRAIVRTRCAGTGCLEPSRAEFGSAAPRHTEPSSAGNASAARRQTDLGLFADGTRDLAADTVSVSRTTALSELIGARVTRIEDQKLLCGGGRYVDDIVSPGALVAAFVRSPHPHALIRSVDADAARALPGVTAVLTLDDLMPVLAQRRMMRISNSGTRLDQSWAYALADGEVSFVGEPVAIVVATDRYIAEDAVASSWSITMCCRPRSIAGRRMPNMRRAVRRELSSNKIISYKVVVRRYRCGLRQCGPCSA